MNKAVKKVSYKRMDGKDRKKQILRVAQHVFAEDNYYGATIAKIAHAADVTEPTIYLYFKDKRDLFLAVVEDCASFQLSAMKLIIEGTNDLKQAGLNLIREDHRFITQVTSDVEKIMNMARVINDPEIKARVRRFNTEIHRLLTGYIEKAMAERVIRDDVDPRVLARILMGVVTAMRTMLLLESDEEVDSIFIDAAEFLEKVILKH
jgi:TetR/AcrR family fatty acid metabolism transcriptional regulator